jgi:LPS O-antigen subunit length determinant protein (WzzB/FepE family)
VAHTTDEPTRAERLALAALGGIIAGAVRALIDAILPHIL